MEQACRGWLPSGALSHSFDAAEKAKKEVKSPKQATKLSDDNLFIQQQTSEESIGSTNVQKSLVQNVQNYRNRIKRKP
eukprot:scaffold41514_cov133-Skeletonema_dohrnii-CCMP3373.AAC.1